MDIEEIRKHNLILLKNKADENQEKIISCSNGVLLVKNDDKNKKYKYIGRNWKIDELFKANEFSYGFGLAKREFNGRYFFVDENGNESQTFYMADSYYGQIARVQIDEQGPVYFRNQKGELSKPYSHIDRFCEGYYRVREENGHDAVYKFVNADGEEMKGEFLFSSPFENGFSEVYVKCFDGKMYVDLLGRLSKEPTKSGKDYFLFANKLLQLKDLNDDYFNDRVFARGVIEYIKRDTIAKYKEAYSKLDKEFVLKECRFALNYVLKRANYIGFGELMSCAESDNEENQN